ncbi:hypothetical protein [Microbacterium sp.]|uniref:hypothetical protein n=1 Tax=Microbacterium sp. TaxID=51671 RepID=UPI0039E4CBED
MSARIPVNYPAKRSLSESEAVAALKHGPDIAWFRPWAKEGVILAGDEVRYALVHVFLPDDADTLQYDVRTFHDEEGLRWAMEALYSEHPRCGGECVGLFYVVPQKPIRMFAVLEDELVSLATDPDALYIVSFGEGEASPVDGNRPITEHGVQP